MLTFVLISDYNISTKVGEYMSSKVLNQLLQDNKGILRSADAAAAGISKDCLYRFIKENNLEKAAHGIYLAPDSIVDSMFLLQSQIPKVIFSHETALYLHDLSEMEPMPLSVTVPSSYHSRSLTETGTTIYYAKPAWYLLGVMELESPSGFPVKVYDMERTICDIIRKRTRMDISVFNYAIKEYMKRKDKNLVQLMKYATELRMEQQLREAIGVLL